MKRYLYHGTSSKFMKTIRKEGLIPFVDLTYKNGLTDTYPIVYLAESMLFAKIYAYFRCYGTELKDFIHKKYNLPPTPPKLSRMVFFLSEGGKPEVATISIEVSDSELDISPLKKGAQLFSDDHNTKEYMVFRPIEPEEIVKIEPVEEPLSQLCSQILKEANPKAVQEAAEYKKKRIAMMSSASGGKIVAGHNMFDIAKMIAESPEIDTIYIK